MCVEVLVFVCACVRVLFFGCRYVLSCGTCRMDPSGLRVLCLLFVWVRCRSNLFWPVRHPTIRPSVRQSDCPLLLVVVFCDRRHFD